MRTAVILSALLASGCSLFLSGHVIKKERQEQAAWVIWHDTYGREDMPPAVRWVEGGDLDCTEADGIQGFRALVCEDDCGHPKVACLAGITLSPLEVSVAYHPGDFYAETSLAHEYMHAWQFRRGIIDPKHTKDAWKPQAACTADSEWDCGYVERARAALIKAGL